MSFVKEKLLNTLTKYWKLLEFIIDDKIDIAKREVALGEIGTVRGSTSESNGRVGLVPAPESGDETNKFLKADGTWTVPYDTATNVTSGLTKLYDASGNNVDGAITQSGITTLLDSKANTDHTHNYLPLSGGTITGKIIKDGISTSWNKGRDNVLLSMYTINGYSPVISIKTTNGTWDIGTYNYSGYTDELIISFVTDALYNGTNAVPPQFRMGKDHLTLPSGITLK